jgi:hypothetical protein
MKPALWITAPVLLVALAGCKSKLTMDNYTSVKNGMTLDEVENLLGPGEKQTEGQAASIASGMVGGIPGAGGKKPPSTRELFLWKEDRVEVSVTFESGKVIDKNQRGLR